MQYNKVKTNNILKIIFTIFSIGTIFLGTKNSYGQNYTPSPSLQAQKPLAVKTKMQGIPKVETPLSDLYLNKDIISNIPKSSLDQVEKYITDKNVRVLIIIKDIKFAFKIKTILIKNKGSVTAEFETNIEAIIPISYLKDLSENQEVLFIRTPIPVYPLDSSVQENFFTPSANTGNYVTQGVAASNANAWHANNINGSGINVGIIDYFKDLASAQSAGELPSLIYTYGTIPEKSRHGTAVAEIIHDMAPNSSLTIGTPTSATQMANYIVDLAQAGNKIISSSIGYYLDEPGDGSGTVSSAINTATNSYGALYCQAAGNQAEYHWDGFFSDSNSNNFHDFASGIDLNRLAPQPVPSGYPIQLYLRWNDWPVSNQDYDLYLYIDYGLGWEILTTSENLQNGTQPPIERIEIIAPVTAYYAFAIYKFNANGSHVLDIMGHNAPPFEYKRPDRSLIDPATANKSFSVAAVDASSFILEDYSSRGPTHGSGGILSGGNAKPRITAFANVDTWSYAESSPFNGTSSAAPHVAGAAALVRQAYPSYTPDQVMQFLEGRSIDQGDVGYDYIFGVGRLYLGNPPFTPPPPNVSGDALPWLSFLLRDKLFDFTVVKTGKGSGTIISDPIGINCKSDCISQTGKFKKGTLVNLSSTTSIGSIFKGWSGEGCSGTATCQVCVDSTKHIFGQYDKIYHDLIISKTGTGSGTVTSSPEGISCGIDCSQSFPYGSLVTLTATANTGSIFTSWSGGGCTGVGTCQVAIDNTKSVVASFEKLNFNLTVTKTGAGTGTVTSNPSGISCGSDCSEEYPYSTIVTLTASADTGSIFTGWTGGGCSGTGTCQVTMSSVKSVNASFSPAHTLFIDKSGPGTGTIISSPPGISCGSVCNNTSAFFTENSVVTLTASADTGSIFTGWSGGGCSGTGTCQVTMSSDQYISASFNEYTLSVFKSGSGSGTVYSVPPGINCDSGCTSDSAGFGIGTAVSLFSTTDSDSTFIGWSGDGCTGTDSCQIFLNESVNIFATYDNGNSSCETTWEVLPSGASDYIHNIIWGNGQLVAIGRLGLIITSNDGITWTTRNSGVSEYLAAGTFNGGQFVVVGFNGTILTSLDGTNWTAQSSGTTQNLVAISWNGVQFVAVGSNGTILTSLNGVNWQPQVSNAGDLRGVVWNGTNFVVVGNVSTILTSPDGVIWTKEIAPGQYPLGDIAWNGNTLLALSARGDAILNSTNGINWNVRALGASFSTEQIEWGGGIFVIVGSDGGIITSSDGIDWTTQSAGTRQSLYGITWNGTRFYAVGLLGDILISKACVPD